MSVLRLGDKVFAQPYWPLPGPRTGWLGYVKAFRTGEQEAVLVEACELSDDPLVTNEQWFSFGALERRLEDLE